MGINTAPSKKSHFAINNGKMVINMRSKFILAFLLITLIPFVSFCIITYNNTRKVIEKNVHTVTMHNINKTGTNVDYYLKDMKFIMNLVSNNPLMIDYFNKISNHTDITNMHDLYKKTEEETGGHKIISKLINLKGNLLSGIYFMDNSSVYFVHPEYSYKLYKNQYPGESWYCDAMNNPDTINILGTRSSFFNKPDFNYVFSAVKPLQGFSDEKPAGLFLVNFNYNSFSKLVKSQTVVSYPGSILYIVNRSDKIMFCSDKKLLTRKLDNSLSVNINNKDSGSKFVNHKGKRMFMVYCTSQDSLWKIINLIPAKTILRELLLVKYSMIILTAACIIVILILAFIVSSRLFKPINKLTDAMAEVENGNLSVRVNIRSHDETRLIADSFNKMVSNIEHLIQKVYNFRIKQKEAELNSLQNQINPHFLYNTLESIRGVALYHGISNIAEMAKCLSMLFHYNINGKVVVPIKEEIKHLNNYLKIQNFRHDNKFDIIYDIPDDMYDLSILKLCLQPLVENSIKHGLEMKLGKGSVYIKMYKYNNILKIEVSDNGIGIDPPKVRKINLELEKEYGREYNNIFSKSKNTANKKPGTNIGIQNVNSRLKLTFGKQYGLKYIYKNVGTTVEISLPVIRIRK